MDEPVLSEELEQDGLDQEVEVTIGEEREVPSKYCPRCATSKPVLDFNQDRGSKDRLQGYCKRCQVKYRMDWYNSLPLEERLKWRRAQYNPEKIEGEHRRRRERAWNLRLEMIAAYGGCCSCCGEAEPQFLTLEHLNGGGRAHMRRLHKAANIYKELKSLGWPQGDYTCLCFNCNSAKGHFGECPHVRARLARA